MGYEPLGNYFIGPLRPLYGSEWWRPSEDERDLADQMAGSDDGPYQLEADHFGRCGQS